ncbi:hypothetical protein [Peribacillus deserti]|nr:hypothetical protein [Peribacillus deserti]
MKRLLKGCFIGLVLTFAITSPVSAGDEDLPDPDQKTAESILMKEW